MAVKTILVHGVLDRVKGQGLAHFLDLKRVCERTVRLDVVLVEKLLHLQRTETWILIIITK